MSELLAPAWLQLVLAVVGAGLGVVAGLALVYVGAPVVSYLFFADDDWGSLDALQITLLLFPPVGFFVGGAFGVWMACRICRAD